MKLYSNVRLIFLFWVLTILIISYFGFVNLPHGDRSVSSDFLKRFAIWDGAHYVDIAQFGYREKSEYAYFPLYPLLINLFTKITGNYTVSGVLISILSAFLGLQFFYQILCLMLSSVFLILFINGFWSN